MLGRALRHLRQNTVAYLALFFALSSSSYAAVTRLLPANSVGTRQVINGSLKKVDLSRKTVAALHGAPGQTGPQGPPGPAGTVASLDDLSGKPCTVKGQSGIVHLLKPVSKGGFSVSIVCLRADEWEPNDSLTSPVSVSSESNSDNTSKNVNPSIYPAGDNDFFKLTDAVSQIFLGGVRSEPVAMNIYKDGTLVASNVPTGSSYVTGDATSHTWIVQVSAAPGVMTVYGLSFNCSSTCLSS